MNISDMTVEELIQKFEIEPITYGRDAGKVMVKVPKNSVDRAALIDRIPEIKKYFSDKKAIEDAERARKEANVASIAGLKEIMDLQEANAKWNYEFKKSFEDCGGLGVGKRPEGDEKELLAKYPQAAAYLRVKAEAEKENYELATIGKKALSSFEDNPSKWEEIISKMDKSISEFSEKHIWD